MKPPSPTVRDRVVMTAAKIVLEPIFESDFLPSSFGFRPKRSAQSRPSRSSVGRPTGVAEWVLDADIKALLGCPIHTASLVDGLGFEQGRIGVGNLYS